MVSAIHETRKIPVYRGFQAGHYLFAGWSQSPGCEREGTSPPDILIFGIQELQMGFLPVARSDGRLRAESLQSPETAEN